MNTSTAVLIITLVAASRTVAFLVGTNAFSVPPEASPRSNRIISVAPSLVRTCFASEIFILRSNRNENNGEYFGEVHEGNDAAEADVSMQPATKQFPTPATFVSGVASELSSASSSIRSKVSSTAEKTSSNMKSVAESAWSGTSSTAKGVTKRSKDVVQTVARTAQTGLTDIVSKAGSVVGTTGSDIASVVRKGSSDTASIARKARSGFTGLVTRAGTVTGTAGSSLVGAMRQSRADTVAVVQWIDNQAKDGVSRTNTKAKEMVLKFTGKSDYVFGDIALELLRRASASDVSIQDILLVLKILLTVGASFTPLAKLLPLTVLLDMLNVSIEARIGGKLLEVIAESLDDRFKAAVTAEELGDLTKRSLIAGITAFTGKERYEEGDIERAVQEQQGHEEKQQTAGVTDKHPIDEARVTSGNANTISQDQKQQAAPKTFDLRLGSEFEAWDTAFRESHPGDWEAAINNSLSTEQMSSKDLDMEIVNELYHWDKKFEELYDTENE